MRYLLLILLFVLSCDTPVASEPEPVNTWFCGDGHGLVKVKNDSI